MLKYKFLIYGLVLLIVFSWVLFAETLYVDDGISDEPASGGEAGMELAEWFTPPIYPCQILAILYYPYNTSTLHWKVWDDDGTPDPVYPGEPNTVLDEGYETPTTIMDWFRVDLTTPIVIADGSFYAGWREDSPGYQNGWDSSPPQDNQACFYWPLLSSWALFSDPMIAQYGDIMIRAIVSYDMSVEEQTLPNDHSIKVYPNPFNSQCKIITPADVNIQIVDIEGRIVENKQPDNSGNCYIWQPRDEVASGIYLVHFGDGLTGCTKRILYTK